MKLVFLQILYGLLVCLLGKIARTTKNLIDDWVFNKLVETDTSLPCKSFKKD